MKEKLDARQSPSVARPAAPLAAFVQRHQCTKTNKIWLSWQRPRRDRKTNVILIIYRYSSTVYQPWKFGLQVGVFDGDWTKAQQTFVTSWIKELSSNQKCGKSPLLDGASVAIRQRRCAVAAMRPVITITVATCSSFVSTLPACTRASQYPDAIFGRSFWNRSIPGAERRRPGARSHARPPARGRFAEAIFANFRLYRYIWSVGVIDI